MGFLWIFDNILRNGVRSESIMDYVIQKWMVDGLCAYLFFV